MGYWYHFIVLIALWLEINEPPVMAQELPNEDAQVIHWNRGQNDPGGQGQVTMCMTGQSPAALNREHEGDRRPIAYHEDGWI